MRYFVTGATGFIGKRLVRRLLQRRGTKVYFLLRPQSEGRVGELLDYWGVDKSRAIAVPGDLTAGKKLGVRAEQLEQLAGIDSVFHLGAIYDLAADAAEQVAVNVRGTRHAVAFAKAIGAGHFHHVSSIAAAGLYEGVFREDMFDEAERLEHPYFATKHESERIVREECDIPWTVYRPAMVVGDSRTGEMEKIDGPYYFFKLIQKVRRILPPWTPAIGFEGGRINVVPVDFVVDAIDHISHAKGRLDGKCFHLVDPTGYRLGEVLAIFSRVAHAPRMGLFVNSAMLDLVPRAFVKSLMASKLARRLRDQVMKDLGLPAAILEFLDYPTLFDCRETLAALEGSGIACPRLEDYAWRLWDYWERHLDPDLLLDRSLEGAVRGKVVVVTGGSSGIGLAAARRFARAGAITVIVARDSARLDEARKSILESSGPDAQVLARSADLADEESCHALVQWLTETFAGVDVLVNNAGRSIRRSIESSYERLHDFERTMQVNYFGSLRLTMGLLPGMGACKAGHVINVSSIGVQTGAPRFSAYVASKAALDAWTRCAASELADSGIDFTTISMPLVRTPMIAPTRVYDGAPALTPEEAAELIVQAVVRKPARIGTPLGTAGELLHALVPRVSQSVMGTTYRMFPDGSVPEKGKRDEPSAEAQAMRQMMRGLYW